MIRKEEVTSFTAIPSEVDGAIRVLGPLASEGHVDGKTLKSAGGRASGSRATGLVPQLGGKADWALVED